MLGSNAAAKAFKLQQDLKNKSASRKYEAYCQSCGMSVMEARLLEPPKARTGRLLRAAEESRRKMDAIKAKKEMLQNRFG